ncbi:TetR/AcrR family transcriptional regulator [Rhodococcus erythropolis]|uniref:TetR/AcrR family transcriptional regulator n=1 Tax=Rhodococcus erythropolis TaxID=1833 RepID=UPI0038106707
MDNASRESETELRPQSSSLRADAERNRERIMAAARRLYAVQGLGVSMAMVAREAGVGKATLSRRFSTREELISAVFSDRMDHYAAATKRGLANPDAWQGFVGYVEEVCAMQAADRGFAAVLTMTFDGAEALEARRVGAYEGFLQLIARARATGWLRADFTSADLIVLFMANCGVITALADDVPDGWRRLLGHMLRGFATPDAPLPPMPDAPGHQALYSAMARIGRSVAVESA